MTEPTVRLSRTNTIAWLFFVFLASLYVALSYNAIPDYLNMADYTSGLSPTPYQYRALPMFLFRALVDRPLVIRIAAKAPVEFRTPYQIVQLGISFLALAGCVLASYGSLKRLTGFDRQFSRWASLLILYMAYFTLAPGWGLKYTYPYDTPSLFFFCLGIYLVVCEERWKKWLYYAIFPLAALNRETACFLTLFYLIWEWRKARESNTLDSAKGRLLMNAFAQMVIWIAVKKALGHAFAANTAEGDLNGTYLGTKLLFNLKEIFLPQQWPALLSIGGFLLPAIYMGRKWIRNPGIEWACAIIIPLWVLGMFLVGVVIEIRVFSELNAMTSLALALIVYNRFYKPSNDALKV
jgi:hypothetical protein